MLSAVSGLSNNFNQVTNNFNNSFADVRITKILLAFISAAALAVSFVAFTANSTVIPIFVGIPLLAISAFSGWIIIRSKSDDGIEVKNYNDATQLQQFRKEAASQSLDVTIAKHGWNNMIYFEIPLKKDFAASYSKYVEKLPFMDLISFHEHAFNINVMMSQHEDSPFEIPLPSDFAAKFYAEVADLTIFDIFDRYDIEKLRTYQIFNDKVVEAKNIYFNAIKERDNALKANQENIHEAVQHVIRNFEKELQKIEITDPRQSQYVQRLKNFTAHAKIFDFSNMSDNGLQFSNEDGILKPFYEVGRLLIEGIVDLNEKFISSKKQIELKFENACLKIENNYQFADSKQFETILEE